MHKYYKEAPSPTEANRAIIPCVHASSIYQAQVRISLLAILLLIPFCSWSPPPFFNDLNGWGYGRSVHKTC